MKSLEELEIGKVYTIDTGNANYQSMRFLRRAHNGYEFVVLEHFMDNIHENWEKGDTWLAPAPRIYEVLGIKDPNEIYEIDYSRYDKSNYQRKDLLRALGQCWNMFCDLPEDTDEIFNADDKRDFRDAIHKAQRVICTQELKLQHPEFFE